MKKIIDKVLKAIKNFAVFFCTYMIIVMVLSGAGLEREPIMLNEFNAKKIELENKKIDLGKISYDTVYEKNKSEIEKKENELKSLQDKKSKVEKDIQSLQSKLN